MIYILGESAGQTSAANEYNETGTEPRVRATQGSCTVWRVHGHLLALPNKVPCSRSCSCGASLQGRPKTTLGLDVWRKCKRSRAVVVGTGDEKTKTKRHPSRPPTPQTRSLRIRRRRRHVPRNPVTHYYILFLMPGGLHAQNPLLPLLLSRTCHFQFWRGRAVGDRRLPRRLCISALSCNIIRRMSGCSCTQMGVRPRAEAFLRVRHEEIS